MNKTKMAIQNLITNGYDENLALQLPKLFIEDFFENEQEKISESLDKFIDGVQRGNILPDANNNVSFASIIKITDSEMDPEAVDGILWNFKTHINENFMHTICKPPLYNMLINGGALTEREKGYYPSYSTRIVGTPEEYSDLCVIYSQGDTIYVKINDLYSLLLKKGFDEGSVRIVLGEYGYGPRYPKAVPNDGIYLNYNSVMNYESTQAYQKRAKN